MKKVWMVTGVMVLVVALAAGTVGSAFAQGNDPAADRPARGVVAVAQIIDVMVYLNPALERADVRRALADGQTLGEIAVANGLSVDNVVAETIAHTANHLQVAVVDGRISQEEADATLAEATAFYPEAMTMTVADLPGTVRDRLGTRFDNGLLAALADAAGLTPREVLGEMIQPVSMADVATELGLDPATILDTAEADITAAIHDAVANEQITQEQANALLDGLRERLEERFNTERPLATWLSQARQTLSGLRDGFQSSDQGGRFRQNRPGLFGGQGKQGETGIF